MDAANNRGNAVKKREDTPHGGCEPRVQPLPLV